jgi:ferredoxin-NADP reductase
VYYASELGMADHRTNIRPSSRTAAAAWHSGDAGTGLEVTCLFTREAPGGWPRRPGRMTPGDVDAFGWPPGREPHCFVCGPTGFVETAADILVGLGHDPRLVKTERFGPTGS